MICYIQVPKTEVIYLILRFFIENIRFSRLHRFSRLPLKKPIAVPKQKSRALLHWRRFFYSMIDYTPPFSCLEYDRSNGNIVCEHLLLTIKKLGVTRQVFNLFQGLWNRFPYFGVGGAQSFGAKTAQTERGLAPAETY